MRPCADFGIRERRQKKSGPLSRIFLLRGEGVHQLLLGLARNRKGELIPICYLRAQNLTNIKVFRRIRNNRIEKNLHHRQDIM